MAVARLARVTLEAPRDELGALLAKAIQFTMFHPLRREGMVQDIELLLLASKAQAIYAEASDLLAKGGFKTTGERKEVEKLHGRGPPQYLFGGL